jgi:hypothetical protein
MGNICLEIDLFKLNSDPRLHSPIPSESGELEVRQGPKIGQKPPICTKMCIKNRHSLETGGNPVETGGIPVGEELLLEDLASRYERARVCDRKVT